MSTEGSRGALVHSAQSPAASCALNEQMQELSALVAGLQTILREMLQAKQDFNERQQPLVQRLSADLDRHASRLLGRTGALVAELASLQRSLSSAGGNECGKVVVLRKLYLDLLENALTGRLYRDPSMSPWFKGYDDEIRLIGRDWPSVAQTMIGSARMRNIRMLAEQIIADGVAGDFLEAGVWRGGACIYMRGILHAYSITDRKVWVADSFAGLPAPDSERYPADAGDLHHTLRELVVPLDEFKSNFARYELLDDQVSFLKGWFRDTLREAPLKQLSLLRLDGDMYSSTTETLQALYHKLTAGGFIIIDDYILPGCRKAVNDFREANDISEPIQDIDGAGVYWQRTS